MSADRGDREPAADHGSTERVAGRTMAAGPAGSDPGQAGPLAARKRGRTRVAAICLLLALGLSSTGAGGFLLRREMGRAATPAEIAAAGRAELAARWRELPAGMIFPPSVTFLAADFSGNSTARLVGVAVPASCSVALDAQVLAKLSGLGCVTVLRATYIDYSGTIAATIGIAVLRSPRAATAGLARLSDILNRSGLRVAVFPGTIAAGFGDPQRAVFNDAKGAGPYLYFVVGGDTDGRPGSAGGTDANLTAMANGLLAVPEAQFRLAGRPCALREVRC
jgi:hypothetical protein